MKKATQFRICNWSILAITILILASGLQLEINPYGDKIWVWLHIAVGTLYATGVVWHMKLHNWPRTARARRNKHPWLGTFSVLALLSGIIDTVHWLGTFSHSTIGGLHGKIGFIMLIAVFIHLRKHIRFYRLEK